MAYRYGGETVVGRVGARGLAATLVAPPLIPVAPGEKISCAHVRRAPLRCPELDCLRGHLPSPTLERAERRAAAIGVCADRVLIAMGAITEEDYVAAFATRHGISFEPLNHRPRAACPISDAQLIEAAATGLLPLTMGDGLAFVVVPQLVDSRRLAAALAAPTALTRRIRVTSLPRLQRFVARHAAREIEHRAERALHEARPELSARGKMLPILTLTVLAFLIAIGAFAAPYATLLASEIAFAGLFLAWTSLRIFGLWSERLVRRRRRTVRDDWLPTYTVIVPLYREAAALAGLIAALRRLDYPVEKLDIKLVVEADDRQTREALARLRLGASFEIVIAPASGPRTKPKALNAALPFARGSFIAIYDAEDRPEPDQLRVALEAFIAGDERLACVQARLTIDNTADSWLARLFTAEYAGLFDVFLPGLAVWRLPLPLGGSSNHFRASVLRAIGAWDPFNVTEDADLGMRLARFGYGTTVILSTTYEEAPARFRPWIRQRTRWFKGWLQTWLVHMRAPRPLLHELGWSGFAVFQLMVGGTVLAALIHSLFAAEFLRTIAVAWWTEGTMADVGGFPLVIMFGGYFVSGLLGLIGLKRRRLLGSAWALLLMPAYWLLLSLAAWRALFQLLSHPHRWEKTEHGLARTSRLAGADVRRQRLKRRARAKDSGADRRRPPRGAA